MCELEVAFANLIANVKRLEVVKYPAGPISICGKQRLSNHNGYSETVTMTVK